jgi:hydroxyacyl-ACP dehydratase HTD2-like protein with hotdog domain
MILHGEQEFIYHRPIVVGDELVSEGKVTDIYEKQSGERTMTFIVTETVFSDAKSGDPVLTQRFNLIHRS